MKRVLLLDDDIDLCEIMREIVLELGASACTIVHSFDELKQLPNIKNGFDLIFIDMNLGISAPSGIEVYKWLNEIGHNGKIAFFSGHDRSHPMIKLASVFPNVSIIEKPPSESQLEALLR